MEVLGRAQLHRVLKQPQPQLQLHTLIYLKSFSFKCVQITKKICWFTSACISTNCLGSGKKKLEIRISLNNIIETESTFFSHRVCGLGLLYVTILFTILFIKFHNAIFSNTIFGGAHHWQLQNAKKIPFPLSQHLMLAMFRFLLHSANYPVYQW